MLAIHGVPCRGAQSVRVSAPQGSIKQHAATVAALQGTRARIATETWRWMKTAFGHGFQELVVAGDGLPGRPHSWLPGTGCLAGSTCTHPAACAKCPHHPLAPDCGQLLQQSNFLAPWWQLPSPCSSTRQCQPWGEPGWMPQEKPQGQGGWKAFWRTKGGGSRASPILMSIAGPPFDACQNGVLRGQFCMTHQAATHSSCIAVGV